MSSVISSLATKSPTIELETDVIVGHDRSTRRISLRLTPQSLSYELQDFDTRLLVAINPTDHLYVLRSPRVQPCMHDGDMFWFEFPNWMTPQWNPDAWQSQSASGAFYPSRTDLRDAFGVAGVLLLQVLQARDARPCFTSRHEHYATREVFEPLDAAKCAEYRRGDARWRRLKETLDVPPRVRHQLRRVAPGFSVNLIQMYGAVGLRSSAAGPLLDMSDHIYVRK